MKTIYPGYTEEKKFDVKSKSERGVFTEERFAYKDVQKNNHMIGREAFQSVGTASTLSFRKSMLLFSGLLKPARQIRRRCINFYEA